jgi:hypothetical protein
MINLLVARSWDAAGRLGVEQDLEGLLEPAGAVTARDECGMDRPPGGAGLAGFPAHRVDLLLGGQDGRGDDAGLGSAGRARGVGTGRGPVRNYQRRPEFVDCVRMVHLMKNALAFVPRAEMQAEVVADLRAVFDAPDRPEAERQLGLAVKKYRTSAPKLASWLEANVPEGLTVFALPRSHRRRLRTSNMLERLNEEIKRRTRVAGLFPNDASLLRLVSAVLMEVSEDWETNRTYLTMGPA